MQIELKNIINKVTVFSFRKQQRKEIKKLNWNRIWSEIREHVCCFLLQFPGGEVAS